MHLWDSRQDRWGGGAGIIGLNPLKCLKKFVVCSFAWFQFENEKKMHSHSYLKDESYDYDKGDHFWLDCLYAFSTQWIFHNIPPLLCWSCLNETKETCSDLMFACKTHRPPTQLFHEINMDGIYFEKRGHVIDTINGVGNFLPIGISQWKNKLNNNQKSTDFGDRRLVMLWSSVGSWELLSSLQSLSPGYDSFSFNLDFSGRQTLIHAQWRYDATDRRPNETHCYLD